MKTDLSAPMGVPVSKTNNERAGSPEQALYDVAVVGSGPAGLSAALNAAIRQKSVVLFGASRSERLLQTESVENYLGLPGESGETLLDKFLAHVRQYPDIVRRQENVQIIYDMGEAIGLLLAENEIIRARSVILATGVNFGTPLPGEEKFLGKGVGYCATCDAALYKDRPVVVVGYNEEAVTEVNFIAEMASSVVFVNCTGREYSLAKGVQGIRQKPLEILGDDRARALRLEEEVLEADGFFLLRDARAADALVPGIALEGRHVAVDRNMATNLPGIFAAGDLVGTPYQINVACGRGQIAGLAAARYATMRSASVK